nr:MAG TPA: hypothetical protein [Caudoviricetes sp.]
MKKVKFLKSKLVLTFSVIAVISFAVFVYTAIAANAQIEANRAAEAKSKNENPKKVEGEDKSAKPDDNPVADNSNIADGVDGVQDVTDNGSGVAPVSKPRAAVRPQPVVPAPAPVPAPKPADTPKKDGGHIPFTNKPVTPGNPESYAGTVGQCPFYEMAGEKGCYPPANIECNADWTVCKEKKQ